MKARAYLATMLRESRGSRGRLVFFTACLALGVAAVVGVAGMTGALEDGIVARSRELLAADLVASSWQPLPDELGELLEPESPERTDMLELSTLAAAAGGGERPGKSQLVNLRVVDGTFPFHGGLVLSTGRSLGEELGEDTAVVAPELLRVLEIEEGDELLVGGEPFTVTATVLEEPDKLGFSFTLGPRIFLSRAGFDRTDLGGFGSRQRHKALFRFPEGDDRALMRELERRLDRELPAGSRVRVETHEEAQPRIRRGLERVRHDLGLVALLSLVLGGTGVAQIVRSWLAGRTRSVATLRCLGFRPRQILLLYLGHVGMLALAGSLLGSVAGASLPLLVPALAPELVPPELVQAWQPAAMLRGLGLGLGVALLFSLPPLSAVWRVPPALVLRSDAVPLPAPALVRWGTRLALLAGLFGAAWAQSEELDLAAAFTAGLAALVGLLSLASRLVMRLAARARGVRGHPYLAHGLAALARPGAGTTGAITALGLGVLVVLAMALVQGRLADELLGSLPEEAPSAFLVDVQPDQWPGVEALLQREGAANIESVPWATARLASLDGMRSEELVEQIARLRRERDDDDDDDDRDDGGGPPGDGYAGDEERRAAAATGGEGAAGNGAEGPATAGASSGEGAARDGEAGPSANGAPDDARREGRSRRRARWVLTREQRLAWMEGLPEGNEILEGALWSHPGKAEVSLEEEYAEDMGAQVGSTIVFDVQGVPVEMLVSSIRSVDWRTFNINFFVVVEPGVLDDAPHLRVATARMDDATRQRVQDHLAVEFPNVTLLDIRRILEKVVELMSGLAFAVRLLGAFTILTGLAVLAGAIASSALRRGREAALLKTLGVTRRGVAALLATEYALCGLVAGLVGGLGAYALTAGFLHEVLELEPALPWAALPLACAGAAALAVVAGIAASGRALAVRPMESLRG